MASITRFSLTKKLYGLVSSERKIIEYEVKDLATEVSINFITYGATVTKINVPDKHGTVANVTLCYDTLQDLVDNQGPYYGCIAGRFANRIQNGTFELNDEKYQLAVNNGPNSLHGGLLGFDKQVWNVEEEIIEDNRAGVKLSYHSVDGEEGYPGHLKVCTIYCTLLLLLNYPQSKYEQNLQTQNYSTARSKLEQVPSCPDAHQAVQFPL